MYGKIPQRNVSRKKTWSTTTKNGETVTLRRRRVNPLRRANMRKEGKDWQAYNAYDSKGKKIGKMGLDRKSNEEMNITWLSVNKKMKNAGYGSAILKAGEKIAKEAGASKMTGEVVGISPDMLHITDREGYAHKGKLETEFWLEVWGGATLVEKKLK